MQTLYSKLVAWALVSMQSLQPVTDGSPRVPWASTYETTADSIVTAALAHPLVGRKGPDVPFTVALMVVWAYLESRFDPQAVGDSGASFGLFQVNPSTAGEPKEKLLDADDGPAIALRLIHLSFTVCRDRPVEERMAQYAYGRDCAHRLELSRGRVQRAAKLARTFKLEE